MKRIVSVLLLSLLLVSQLCGCSKGGLYEYKDLSKYIEITDDVKGIEYTSEVAPVTQQSVDAFVNSELDKRAYGELSADTDRVVASGDTVNIDYVGTKDGVAFDGGTAKGYNLVIGSGSFVDGFEDGVIGMKVGEKKTLDITFPENYYEGLAGAAVKFDVTVNSIKVYPELTDDIVKEISNCKTVDEYLEYVNGQLLAQNQLAADTSVENQIWSGALACVKVKSLPEKEVKYFENLIDNEMEATAFREHNMKLDDYIKSNYGSKDVYEKDRRAQAEAQAREGLVVVAIAREKGLELTEKEYDDALATEAAEKKYSVREYEDMIDVEYFKIRTLAQKVRDYLIENAVDKGENK